MVKDRLKDLQEKARTNGVLSSTVVNVNETDSRSPLLSENNDFTDMDRFLEDVSKINNDLNQLETYLADVQQLHSKLLTTPGADRELSKKLNEVVHNFNIEAKYIRERASVLDANAKAPEQLHVSSDSTVTKRIKTTQVMTIVKRMHNVICKFNTEQLDYKEKCNKNIQSYLKIQGLEMSEAEIMDSIDQGDFSEKSKGLLLAVADKNALFEDVKSRRDELIRLEASIRELAEMFHDMNLLVASQNIMIDHIETNVMNAKEYADKAKTNVHGARELQKKARKMKILLCIGLVILVILLYFLVQSLVCHFTPIC